MANPKDEDSVDAEPGRKDRLHGSTPPISFVLSIDFSSYRVSTGLSGRPKLSCTITSHLPCPITVFTYRSILNADQAWDKISVYQNFTAIEMESNQRVWLKGQNLCRRYPLRRQLDTDDADYFLTLHPNTPVTVSYPADVAGWNHRDLNKGLTFTCPWRDLDGEEFRRYFEPGHTYKIGLANRPKGYIGGQPRKFGSDQLILWWRYGTKEEVLEPRDAPPSKTALGWSEPKIRIGGIPYVEVAIEE